MRAFLYEVAGWLVNQSLQPEKYMVVFPNRRSILYFRKHLASFYNRPVIGPELLTFEEFAAKWSSRQVADRLVLIHRLYKAYMQVTGLTESFDAFYFWGNMLLRDFDEIDKHLVNPDHLFKDLSDIKELDSTFDYLTEEQKKYLTGFWSGFAASSGQLKKHFSDVWQHLPGVYHAFHDLLQQEGLTYEGRMFRDAAATMVQQQTFHLHLVFVGFNALTPVQEKIFTHAVSAWNAQVHWDVDDYYMNSEWQEAGLFFRQYRSHPVLGGTFPADIPSNFQKNKQIKVYGSPQATGQAKILARELALALQNGMNPEEAVIVLPDEKMLLPVLHAVSGAVQKLNVSVSFPLSLTPVPSLVEHLAHLQKHVRGNLFYSASVLKVLEHPYLRALNADFQRKYIKKITRTNQLYIAANECTESQLLQLVFKPAGTPGAYLAEILQYLQEQQVLSKLDEEYVRQALQLIMQLNEIEAGTSWDDFMPLFRQLAGEVRIPFAGEPLQGLPVIGMLETRNLDFRHVYVLSVNEGFLPPFPRTGSYLPYSLRKAYQLPVAGHEEAIAAYHFYRLMQRAETVTLFYTTEPDELGRGEMSRFLQQLLLETEPRLEPVLVCGNIKPQQVLPLHIEKTSEVWQQLLKWQPENHQYLSPTSLVSYRNCSLQFYLKYVLDLKEPDKLEDQFNPRLTGNVLHKTMELFYKQLICDKGTNKIERDDFEDEENRLNEALNRALADEFKLQAPVQVEGRQLVVSEMIKRFARKILKLDKDYTPFELLGTERNDYRYLIKVPNASVEVVLGGQIDRIDRKDNVIRIVDYKTGGDKTEKGTTLEDVFNPDKETKASFQTLLYSLLFIRNNRFKEGTQIVPVVMARGNIFSSDFTFDSTDNVLPVMDEFEARLKTMLDELFNRQVPFTQTSQVKICQFCSFKNICYR